MRKLRESLLKGILPLAVLHLIDKQPMHGYQIITAFRKAFGVYFGASTIYPLLCNLEKKGYLKSEWNFSSARPRKIYELTNEGKRYLEQGRTELGYIASTLALLQQQEIIKNWLVHTIATA